MTRHQLQRMRGYLSLFCTLLLALVMFGCEGDRGANGTSTGVVSGTVTDTGNNKLAQIAVTPSPTVNGVNSASTDANGSYSLALPVGNYTLTFTRQGYATQTQQVSILAGQTSTVNATLTQTSAAVVNVASAPFVNGQATLTAQALVNDPALKTQTASFTWTDAAGNVVGTGSSVTVTQPASAALKSAVADNAKVRQSVYPPGHDPLADENDFDVPDFETLDRFQILPISQQAFETGAQVPFRVKATIGFQTFSSSATANIANNTVPFVPNTGIRNVPVGQPVVLQGNLNAGTWNWTVAGPTGTAVTALTDPTTRFPHFIPDVPGTYTVSEAVSGNSMKIYAGSYVGILLPAPGDDPKGNLDPGCAAVGIGCHGDATAFAAPFRGSTPTTPVSFFSTTPVNTVFTQWSSSGHRVIMVKGMQLGNVYTLNGCARCHSVGWIQYSSAVKPGGFRDVAQAVGFTDATWRGNAPLFFKGFDQVLRKSEVQCETCHGPNSTTHGSTIGGTFPFSAAVNDTLGSRFSISSDVCGTCHGEPLRHGRYQEWRVSGHGDFQTAMGEGVTGLIAGAPFNAANPGTGPNTNCAGCHTGQGFPLFISQLQGTNGNAVSPLRTLNAANATALGFLRTFNVQPQTCSTCHQVHNPGNLSGLVGNLVILRGDYQAGGAFDGFTPLLPAGFQANGVGRGALCITCHNSRNGGAGATATLHEDGDPNFGALTAYSAPHEACQGDVLMGRNAYFFGGPEDTHNGLTRLTAQVGQRSRHSFIGDACVTCHVQRSPTDPNFGYPPGVSGAGTNHTFNIVTDRTRPAADQINALCSQCHGTFNGTSVQASFDSSYNQLLKAIGNAILRVKYGSAGAIPAGTAITFIPGRTPQESLVSVNNGVPQSLTAFFNAAPAALGTAATGAIAGGFQLDLAKANWNACLVAPKYNATSGGTSYDNGTPILNASGGTVGVAGDQSKGVHNPSFVFNVIQTTINRMNQL